MFYRERSKIQQRKYIFLLKTVTQIDFPPQKLYLI